MTPAETPFDPTKLMEVAEQLKAVMDAHDTGEEVDEEAVRLAMDKAMELYIEFQNQFGGQLADAVLRRYDPLTPLGEALEPLVPHEQHLLRLLFAKRGRGVNVRVSEDLLDPSNPLFPSANGQMSVLALLPANGPQREVHAEFFVPREHTHIRSEVL